MHPYILQSLAAERARDMRQRSTASRFARLTRRGRRAAPAGPQPPRSGSQPALETLSEQESQPVLAQKA
jgi:hypothetical protein